MKNTLFCVAALWAILICGFVLSCKSTGTVSAPTPVSTPGSTSGPNPRPVEEVPLEEIYGQHEVGIILTGAKEHTVVKGDTLSSIARHYYGPGDNGYYFPLIIAASRLNINIVDPDKIEVGTKLVVPDLQENLNDPGARTNLKNLLKKIADFYSLKPGRQSAGLHAGLTRLYNTLL
ncbi:MAG: LysM peptidoglycan-binding domain-containing protein [Treponema sp.]|jgi:LysM repeat protein|nr:LysM peptidoglycan-binding domain-containing protein [Treponema sp.]